MTGKVEDWDELTRLLREDIKYSPKIDRLLLHEYQVCVGIDQLEVASSYRMELWKDDIKICELSSDYRDREIDSFRICEVIGEEVVDCFCNESGVHVVMPTGSTLICCRDKSNDSCTVNSKTIGLVVL